MGAGEVETEGEERAVEEEAEGAAWTAATGGSASPLQAKSAARRAEGRSRRGRMAGLGST
jgi:hypothetical protein